MNKAFINCLFSFLFVLSGTSSVFGQPPVANFSANITSGCTPLTVSFTDRSTGNPTQWNWEFSNGTLSNVRNPVVSFGPGTYSVKLVVRNANGLGQIEKIDYITVFDSPIADFSGNITLGCVPLNVVFTDHSSSPAESIVKWEWRFGDGAASTLQNPSHTYTNTGFYTVSLNVTNSKGCTRRIERNSYIRVVDAVAANFNFSSPATCRPPFAINFQNQSSGPGNLSYTWNFGNGQASTAVNPTAVYNTAGAFTVQLNVQSDLGCSGTIQKTMTIPQTITDFISPATICLGLPISFQNNSSSAPINSFWDFGDGTTSVRVNPVKTFLTAGTYTVRLLNNYANCTDSIAKTVTVIDKPAVDFTAGATVSSCVPFRVQFTDLTAGAVSWLWNFGDGTTSTQQNPAHQYTNFGNYTVSLTATTSTDCANTTVKTDFIKIQQPSIQINTARGCVPFTYTAQATIQSLDPVVSYLWDFGDGTNSNQQNPPAHTYNSQGNFTVSLTITTATGCTKTVALPGAVLVGTVPTVDFSATPLNACASEAIFLTGQAVTSPGATVEWLWDFGDGSGSTLQNPTHFFGAIGNVNVTLTVFNNGCPGSITKVLQVRPPIARFTYQVNCTNRRDVTFTNTSLVDPALTPLTYLWRMGDLANTQFTTATPPVFTYPSPGSYNVTLTVVNGPCSYTTVQTVIITDQFADFSINKNPVCKNETFTLSAINSNAAHIANYAWAVGSAFFPAAPRAINHSLAPEGRYDVSLTITDINGCKHTKTVADYILVNGATANFVAPGPGACLNKAITFTDQSITTTNLVKWEWNFGDGVQQTFTTPPFRHTYSKLGVYEVTLKVTDIQGCTDEFTLPADLLVTTPEVGFRAETFYCPEAPLSFIDTSSGAGLSYRWEFGDGNTSTLQNPQNSYPLGDANYSVKLKITDISGCEDSVTKPAYIKIRSPKAAFDIKDTTSVCPPLPTQFTFKGSDYQSFHWEFGDGGSSTVQNPTYLYNGFGHFIPKLYLVGPGGCIDSAQASVTVFDPVASTQINYVLPSTPACNSLTVDFTLVVVPGFKFIFHFGDGAIDSSQRTTLSHFYSRPSFNTPQLVIIDAHSDCQVTVNGPQRIDILGAIPLFGEDRKQLCDQGQVVFQNFTTRNEPVISMVWNFGDGTSSADENPSHFFTQPGTYPVTLSVTTQSDCGSSFSDTIRVYRTPFATIEGRDTICQNMAEPFDGLLVQPDTLTKWNWSFGNGQTSSQQNNMITYTTAGNYTIGLTTSANICSAVTTKKIYVSPTPTATPVQDPTTIISGAGAAILMNYTGNIVSYNWLPTTRLSCTTCPSPFANPQFTTKYNLQIEDRYGCKNSRDITVLVVCNNLNYFVPNTFSPNGDGRNEVFYPKGTGLFRIKSMRVFNRWGEIVFEKKDFAPNDPSAGWNGSYKGKIASADAYIYTMEILCENNAVVPVKGNVTLLR